MKFKKSLFLSLLVATPLLFTAQMSKAQGGHPNYLRALSDLHEMHAFLAPSLPPVYANLDQERQQAIGEIDEAMQEIREAASEAGFNPNAHPPADANLTPSNRFVKARESGNAAWADVNKEEDNGYLHDLKHRSLKHIEAANHMVDHILRTLQGN
jgi:hypothetical protein